MNREQLVTHTQCDNSRGEQATKHFHESKHPIIRSLGPGEDWAMHDPYDVAATAPRKAKNLTIHRQRVQMRIVIVGLTVVAALAVTANANGQEKAIKRSELPAAVDSTLQAQSKGAELRGLKEEYEKGHRYYEAELRADAHEKDVLVDSTGAVVEVEEQVALDSLPAALKAKLVAHAKPGHISQVVKLTKKGRLVAYEAQVVSQGKKREIQVGPQGETLAHPE